MIDTLIFYFNTYPFVRYAFITGILISLCSSLLGVTLVLKRFSFISDGLSHVAFGGICIAAVFKALLNPPITIKIFNLNLVLNFESDMPFVMIITIIAAIILLKTGNSNSNKIKGDAAIAMISVSSLAIGYLLMNKFKTSTNLTGDVCSTLFGSTSILTLDKKDVWICAILSILMIITFVIFYNKIFAVTFDEAFSTAVGTNTKVYNLFIAIIIAVIIVLAMNLVGSLLISALVIFPTLCSMRLFKSFKSVTISSVIISVVCSMIGIIISIFYDTPVGCTIVATDLIAFIICTLIGKLIK